jgi:hypothetical protein
MRDEPDFSAGEQDFPPLHAAWLIARSARDAAAAWDQPAPPEDLPGLADHLHWAFQSLSSALLSLTCCIDKTPPDEPEPHSSEVSRHVYSAYLVTEKAGAGLLRDLPLHRGARAGSAAAEAGYEMARRISAAALSMGRPSRAAVAARNDAIEAFLHAAGNLSTAIGTLASHLPGPDARRFTTAQARLAEAREHLLGALALSAARTRPAGRLALAARRVRDRNPLTRHAHRTPGTRDHPARLAMTGFPAPPAAPPGTAAGESATTSPAAGPRLTRDAQPPRGTRP